MVLTVMAEECKDTASYCKQWAVKGYCERQYVEFMKKNCKKACNLCEKTGTKLTYKRFPS